MLKQMPRLRRLYATKDVVGELRWHLENQRVNDTLAHPCDGEAWKHFDTTFSEFVSEPSNVRLRLCIAGFSPLVNLANLFLLARHSYTIQFATLVVHEEAIHVLECTYSWTKIF